MFTPRQNEDLPTLWAVAGSTRQVGRTTVTTALGGLLALKDYKVELIRPDFFFNPGEQRQHTQQLCADEMRPIFGRLNKDFISSLSLIFEKLAAQGPQHLAGDRQQLFLDLNASLSHHSLDLFLAADIKLVVVDPAPKAQRELDIFLNACFLRWLELTLRDYDESLHQFLSSFKKRRELQNLNYLDFFDSKKLRQAISGITIHIIVNKSHPDDDVYSAWMQKRKHGLDSNIQLCGHLFFDKQSANLISAITIFFNHLFHHNRLDLFKCIEEKMIQIRQSTDNAISPTAAEPLNTWPYSVVDGRIVLNLDPAEFDSSTTESEFSGLDSDLFD
ncbi:hypothetical protein JXO59_13370 [candidate division KSB1 bacterium]|nr:hypothetical protein [candidate division KSB1 bacterium]